MRNEPDAFQVAGRILQRWQASLLLCKSGLLSFGASDPATIQPKHIQPNRQAESYKNQEMQERQREVTNVYTITRSNLMSLPPMKTLCLTVVRRATLESQRSCRLTGVRVAASASRQERQRYEVINFSKLFISGNRRRILIQGNGHFCGFALFQLAHVAEGKFLEARNFRESLSAAMVAFGQLVFCNFNPAFKYALYLNTKPQSPTASK